MTNRPSAKTDSRQLIRSSRALPALCFVLGAWSCAGPASSARCDEQAFRAVALAHANRSEVTVCGTVVQVAQARQSRSGVHRTFVVDAGGSERVEVDANLAVMGNVPIRRGQTAIVHGEYYYDRPGREGVHWTHRTVRGSHPPGYIILDGTTYE